MTHLLPTQRWSIILTLGAAALVVAVPPHKQTNQHVSGGTSIKWAGFGPLTDPPPQPGGRGGSVSIFVSVLGAELLTVFAVGGWFTFHSTRQRPPASDTADYRL
jgi:hypothetical protein